MKLTLIGILACALTLSAQTSRVSSKNTSLTVYAGPNQTITLPGTAALAGSVTALPKKTPVTSTWSSSGPASVQFADMHAPATTATFSIAGSYVLTLDASTSKLHTNSKVTVTVNPNAGPPAPVTVSIVHGIPPKLSWGAVSTATGYNVYRSMAAGVFSATPLNASPLTSTTYTDNTTVTGLTYFYAVTAVNKYGEGHISNSIQFLASLERPSIFAAMSSDTVPCPFLKRMVLRIRCRNITLPVPVAVTIHLSTYPVLQWTSASGATGYKVYRSSTPGSFTGSSISGTIAPTTYQDTTTVSGTTYYYMVVATNSSGDSANSNQVKFSAP